ncbi:MAG TPA: hypothetical protein VFA54_01080 [Bryobacterales bacterium]|nr:hypothetical protein [Bryobacterales bacterium]
MELWIIDPGGGLCEAHVLLFATAWAAPASSGAINTLTPQESAQDWKLLWDKKTLDGWKINNGKNVLDAHHSAFQRGAIGLQHTGQKIEFRNIKIRPL